MNITKILNIRYPFAIYLFILICTYTLPQGYAQSPENSGNYYVNLAPIENTAKNELDSLGRKTGYWSTYLRTDGEGNFYTVSHYTNGVKNGIERRYYNITEDKDAFFLGMIGLYKDGLQVGQWQSFREDGSLAWISDKIGPNVDFIEEATNLIGANCGPTVQCYTTAFYKSGNKYSEGWEIAHSYTNDIEYDVEPVGTWIFYNEDGSILKTITYGE